jgi:prophage antirepressor-like protein
MILIHELLDAPEGRISLVPQDGCIWYQAHHICGLLGVKNVAIAVRKIPRQEKTKIAWHNGVRIIRPWYLSESGVYRLIQKSRTRHAERARTIISCTILPAYARRSIAQQETIPSP